MISSYTRRHIAGHFLSTILFNVLEVEGGKDFDTPGFGEV